MKSNLLFSNKFLFYFQKIKIRFGIQRELAMELAKVKTLSVEEKAKRTSDFIAEIKTMPIAINQKEANQQHYEVPDEFYQLVLGSCFLK
jgi:cyclopropane-fatty-acyl-phospholipid synthase